MLNVLKNIFAKKDGEISPVYESVMTAALSPPIYRDKLADDTFEGRFAMVAVHTAIALRQLRRGGDEGREMADALYRKVFDGFDYALREQGVSDSTIARKIRGLGEEFFGLARALDEALDADDCLNQVQDVLVRNDVSRAEPARLSALIVDHDRRLTAQSLETLMSGAFDWATVQS